MAAAVTTAPLPRAILSRDADSVRALLASGTVDLCDADAMDLVAMACSTGHVDSLWPLLHHGAALESADADGDRPLHVACTLADWESSLQVIDCLLRCGADVHAENCEGKTPLFTAAEHGNLFAAILLVRHGAEVRHTACGGVTALMAAVTAGRIECVAFLLEKGVPIDATCASGATALVLAACGGRVDLVHMLCGNGADMNVALTTTKYPLTALGMAAYLGHREVVVVLMQRGACRTGQKDIDAEIARLFPLIYGR